MPDQYAALLSVNPTTPEPKTTLSENAEEHINEFQQAPKMKSASNLSSIHVNSSAAARPVKSISGRTGHDHDKLTLAMQDATARVNSSVEQIVVLDDRPPTDQQIHAVNDERFWAKIAILIDSGAVAHTTPSGIFSVEPGKRKEGRPASFAGANASEIPNLGSLSV